MMYFIKGEHLLCAQRYKQLAANVSAEEGSLDTQMQHRSS